ncbi:MAG: aldo/keto reductase [Lachnospiraceae bacterium]|nr:aldo/keto reductase [Lachnospiraceae bacterium]
MQYRKFGNTGVEVSALGFGCMRLPINEDKTINEEKAIAMIRHAIDNGVNYIDTAYPYHQGTSELLVAKALKDGYREKVYLADKLPMVYVEKEEDFEKYLNEQLQKLETEYIDFYLLHAVNRARFETIKKLNFVEKMAAAKAAGKVRHIGFSFHDDLDTFKEIIDYFDGWDFCQIQYNYINTHHQAGTEGLKYAASKGLGVVIMEPLLGGKLANLAPHVAAAFPENKSQVEYALDWLWDQEEVSLLLSGMTEPEQVEQNLEYASRSSIGMVTEEERAIYAKAKEIFDRASLVDCTKCEYCMPCPFGLNIPGIFAAYNKSASHGLAAGKADYDAMETKADACRACHRCEKVCPQNIKISEVMPKVVKTFA